MLPITRVNGQNFTRNSVAVRLNGAVRIVGVDSIDWSDERPAELVSGMNDGGAPIGKAMGLYGCAASIALVIDEAKLFEASVLALDPLALADGGNLARAKFQLMITAREEARVVTATLVDCTITGRARSVGNDGSALIKSYTLQPRLVIEDGLTLARLGPAL